MKKKKIISCLTKIQKICKNSQCNNCVFGVKNNSDKDSEYSCLITQTSPSSWYINKETKWNALL